MVRYEVSGHPHEAGTPITPPCIGDRAGFQEIPVPDVLPRSVGAMASDGSEITTHYQLEQKNPAIKSLYDHVRKPEDFDPVALMDAHDLSIGDIYGALRNVRHPNAYIVEHKIFTYLEQQGVSDEELAVVLEPQDDHIVSSPNTFIEAQPLKDTPDYFEVEREGTLAVADHSGLFVRVLADIPDTGLLIKHKNMYDELSQQGVSMPHRHYYIDNEGNSITAMPEVIASGTGSFDAEPWSTMAPEQQAETRNMILNLASNLSAKSAQGEEYISDVYVSTQYKIGTLPDDPVVRMRLVDDDARFISTEGGEYYYDRTVVENALGIITFVEDYNELNADNPITYDEVKSRIEPILAIAEELRATRPEGADPDELTPEGYIVPLLEMLPGNPSKI